MLESNLCSYERAFRSLLWRLRPRRLQNGVELLLERARARSGSAMTIDDALQLTYSRVRQQAIRHLVRRREKLRAWSSPAPIATNGRLVRQWTSLLEAGIVLNPSMESVDFHCDSGLGGVARWLRAAGYDARFWPNIDDSQLIRETMASSAILLTTDAPLMKRSAINWNVIPALLVPLNAGKHEQYRFVCQCLSLPRKTPRCMTCGGRLASVQKESVRERIPPRTYPWLDEYFECARCGKLFWPGTHWQNVEKQLS